MFSWISKTAKRYWKYFSNCYKVNFTKTTYLRHFHINFPKNYLANDVIIPAAVILKFFNDLFQSIAKYDCTKFHVKTISLSGFRQGLLHTLLERIREKQTVTDNVNGVLSHNLLNNSLRSWFFSRNISNKFS